jgi:hypothetical protein
MKNVLFAVAALIIIGAAVIQGNWSERWGEFPELKIFADRVSEVPMEIGDWDGKLTPALDERTMNAAGAVSSLSCRFQNRTNKDWIVDVHIVCGRMLDVFAHTPDRCYPSSGFEVVKSQVKTSVVLGPDSTADLFTAAFLKSDRRISSTERVYWTFSSDGKWVAPDAPRLALAGQRALFKVYLINAADKRDQGVDNTPSAELAKVLLPQLTKIFFRQANGAAGTPSSASTSTVGNPAAEPKAAPTPVAAPSAESSAIKP